ncbi:serine protease snake-like isoform X2 [Apis dorsata]|uniref:serine protease snake-like isoform X2 n=1 Tax=Apis dorsata TaxID=7462 RepID=UPI001293BC24|nr:serine protease snake-like isoform X2 [Apis dorsata]
MCNHILSNVIFVSLLVILSYAIDDELYEGSQCTLEDGKTGICKKLTDCPMRIREVQRGIRHSASTGRCGFSSFIEIVCCPIINFERKVLLRPADIACQEYGNNVTTKDEKNLSLHIFNGKLAMSSEFPYVVALGYENDNISEPIKYSCGGSLISSQYVLTAAHCVNNINERIPIEVRLGNEDIQSIESNVQRIPISDIIYHPKYKRSTQYNDVAILRLKTKIQISKTTKPICLQTKSLRSLKITPRTSLIVIGWGATSFDAENSVKLRKTPSLSIVSREECEKHYVGHPRLPNGIDDNFICAIDNNASRRADACQGDSGGPLLMMTEKDWIEEHVWTNKNEKKNMVKTEFFNITITF